MCKKRLFRDALQLSSDADMPAFNRASLTHSLRGSCMSLKRERADAPVAVPGLWAPNLGSQVFIPLSNASFLVKINYAHCRARMLFDKQPPSAEADIAPQPLIRRCAA